MQLADFAFIHHGNIIKALTAQEAHYLLPVDQEITPQHDHALLLLHGFASSPGGYRAMLPHITGYDRIVCPVLPGHADSIAAFSKVHFEDWRQTARECCAKLVASYTKVSIVGLSLGGALALELSQMFAVHHLYLLAPALKLHYSAQLAYYAAQILALLGCKSLKNYAGDFFSDAYQELTYRRLPIQAILAILAFIQAQSYLQPTCPTDLFFGRYDKVVDCKTIATHYAHQTQVRIHWLNHSAHILPLDGDIETLLAYINKV